MSILRTRDNGKDKGSARMTRKRRDKGGSRARTDLRLGSFISLFSVPSVLHFYLPIFGEAESMMGMDQRVQTSAFDTFMSGLHAVGAGLQGNWNELKVKDRDGISLKSWAQIVAGVRLAAGLFCAVIVWLNPKSNATSRVIVALLGLMYFMGAVYAAKRIGTAS